MIVYIFIFSLFYLSSVFEAVSLKVVQRNWLFLFLSALLAVFVGLRYNTGGDWLMYNEIFNLSLSAENEYLNKWEYGYILLNKIFKIIFNNYYILQFTISVFLVFSVYKFYKKEATYPIATLTLLMSFLLFNIFMALVRQSIALAIIVLFSKYIFERKFWLFLSGVLIASFFHASAVVAILLYFLYKNYGKLLSVILLFAANIFYFYPMLLQNVVLHTAFIFPNKLSSRVIIYMDTIFAQTIKFNTGFFYLSLLAIILLLIAFIKIKDNKKAFFINSLIVYGIIKALSVSMPIIGRFESYFLIYAVISFTYIWDIKIKKIQQYWTRVIIAAMLIAFFYIPFIWDNLVSNRINELTNRSDNYKNVPYYNCISHPKEATLRKDWNQK